MADYEVMFSEKNKKLITVDGFKFGFHKLLRDEVERWTCAKRACKSFLKLDSSGFIIERNLNHNHAADSDSTILRQKCSNSLKRKATENSHEPPMKIIRRELNAVESEILTLPDIHKIRHNMTYARSSRRPPLPRTLSELHDAIESYNMKTVRNESFLFINDRSNNIIAFSCATNLESLKSTRILFIDGTFKTSPALFHQIFTVHTIINNIHVPLIYFLLSDKTASSYKNAFLHTQHLINPEIIFVDFETGIHIAVRDVWPNVNLKGCRFHLDQSWWQKIQAVGLTQDYKDRESEDGKLLKYIFGLSLLPPDEVEDAFCFDLMSLRPLDKKYEELFDYLLETYIAPDSKFPPSFWADCTASRIRTTNACEAFHSVLNKLFNSAHPNIYYLADTLAQIQTETYIKLRSTATSHATEKEEYLQTQIDDFLQKRIDRLKFFKRVCFKLLPAKV
jgi:hypothetical protein